MGGHHSSTSMTSATSAIKLIKTRHLQQRKMERGIETKEMKSAVKHGVKQPGTTIGTTKHSYNGVTVVTGPKSAGVREGLTAWRGRPQVTVTQAMKHMQEKTEENRRKKAKKKAKKAAKKQVELLVAPDPTGPTAETKVKMIVTNGLSTGLLLSYFWNTSTRSWLATITYLPC